MIFTHSKAFFILILKDRGHEVNNTDEGVIVFIICWSQTSMTAKVLSDLQGLWVIIHL